MKLSQPRIKPSLEFIKLFSCSIHLSMIFQLLIKGHMVKIKIFLVLKLSDVVFILLINIKMPKIFGIFNIYEQDKAHAQLS